MALTTTSTITAPVNVVFQASLLRNAKARCPYFAGSVPAELQEHMGTFTAKWRRIENLTVPSTALSELTGSVAFPTRNSVTPSITDLTATVAKFGNFIYLTEEVDLLNYNGMTDKLVEILGINAGQAINRQQRNVLEDGLTVILPSGATTATNISGGSTASSNLKDSDLAVAVNAINRADGMMFSPMTTGSTNIGTSPIRPAYLGFTHVDVDEDLRVLSNFIPSQNYAGQVELWPGEVGMLGGVRMISTTEASIDTGIGTAGTGSATAHGRSATSGRTDVYNTVVLGMEAVGSLGFGSEHVKESYNAGDKLPGVQVISHQRGSAGSADPLNEVAVMGWKTFTAGVILNPNWGRVVRHTVDRLQSNE